MSVLIIEDDEVLLTVMIYQIEALELSVRSAQTGKEALKMIESKTPSILILDVMLPDWSAFELVERLRQNPKTKALPVLIHTCLDLSAEEQYKLKLGPTKFITKSAAYSEVFEHLVLEMLNSAQISNQSETL